MYQSQFVEHGLRLEYVETDPSGRYGRFTDVLGNGAMKKVYKAFDKVLGTEVAWNQVKLYNVFRSQDDLQRLYSEVHLLETISHDCIMKFSASWVDVERGTFNFITEMFTSGTLREYRQRYMRVDVRAVKNWARQVLRGLVYMHGLDPPVIHRDLKCDNIFVNGHLGQVKIGDLGLATILRGSGYAHSVVGTPEFMAPEIFDEEYNELVDVYAFGMCVLEMFTSEFPYSECSNRLEIYNKKVTWAKLPDAFHRIEDADARQFVLKCLSTASMRPSARELLDDPFLAHDAEVLPVIPRSSLHSLIPVGMLKVDMPLLPPETKKSAEITITITGTMDPTDDTIPLRVRLKDKHGKAKNADFQFDVVNDTGIDVATELVREFEMSDWEPLEIAKMIDEEISTLVPSWKVNYNQLSFSLDEEDNDDKTPNPFYTSYSCSSSQASVTGFYTPPKAHMVFASDNTVWGQDWVQGDFLWNDDASSHGSLNSNKYSELCYCFGREDDETRGKIQNCTRFCPEERKLSKHCHDKGTATSHTYGAHGSNQPGGKITRNKSLVDIRSHQSLVEEVHKQRLFKTVGSIEDIGFKKLSEFQGK